MKLIKEKILHGCGYSPTQWSFQGGGEIEIPHVFGYFSHEKYHAVGMVEINCLKE